MSWRVGDVIQDLENELADVEDERRRLAATAKLQVVPWILAGSFGSVALYAALVYIAEAEAAWAAGASGTLSLLALSMVADRVRARWRIRQIHTRSVALRRAFREALQDADRTGKRPATLF